MYKLKGVNTHAIKNNKLDQSNGAANMRSTSSIRPKIAKFSSPVNRKFNVPMIRTKAQVTMSRLAVTKFGRSGL